VEDHVGSLASSEKTISVGGGLKKSLAQEETDRGIPTGFALYPNYPNPFNPTTTITYQLPEETSVKLAIYTADGRLIATLVDNVQAAGVYSVKWDASDQPSGVYFCRLAASRSIDSRANDFHAIQKLLLLK